MGEAKRRKQSRMNEGQVKQPISDPSNQTQSTPQEKLTRKHLIPPGYQVLAFLVPRIDCCVEKIVGDFAPYWKEEKYFSIVVNETKAYEATKFLPRTLILFRSATNPLPPRAVHDIASYTKYAQGLGIKCFYYIDDYLFPMNKGAPLFLASLCDEVIVATLTLQEDLLKHKPDAKVHLVKTHINLPLIDSLPRSPLVPTEGYNILFTSSARIGATMAARILEYMNLHPEKYKNVNVIFVAAQVAEVRRIVNKFRNIKKIYYDWLPSNDFYSLVKSCDLILAPGEVGDLDYFIPSELQPIWLDSKSCVKYTLAGAAKIPCIATLSMKEYAQAIKHEQTGFLATTIDTWIKYIDLCIFTPAVSSSIGLAARKDIEENYHVQTRAKEFLEIITGKKREEG